MKEQLNQGKAIEELLNIPLADDKFNEGLLKLASLPNDLKQELLQRIRNRTSETLVYYGRKVANLIKAQVTLTGDNLNLVAKEYMKEFEEELTNTLNALSEPTNEPPL